MATLDSILTSLAASVKDAPPEDSSERNYCIVGKQLLLSPSLAAKYFTASVDGWKESILRELPRRTFADERYCRELYAPTGEALLADAIADLAYAQLVRKPFIRLAKPIDEDQRATAFVIGVYTIFALLLHGRQDYDALWHAAYANYYNLYGARTVREVYDPSWHARYSLHNTFYPLG